MDIYDTSIMDPDPPRPDESSPQRPEDDAPPPPADGEDVSPTLGALKNVGGAALAGLGAVKNVAAGLAATVLDDLLEPEENQGALDDVLRRMSGDEDGDASPPGGLLAHTRNEERRRREARVSVLARHRRDSQNANRRPNINRRRNGTRAPPVNYSRPRSGGSNRTRSTASSWSATWRIPRVPTRPCHRPSTASSLSRPTRSPCLFYHPLYAVSRSLLDGVTGGRRCKRPSPASLSGVWLPRRMMEHRERTWCQKQIAGTLFGFGLA